MNCDEIQERPLKKEMLKSDDTYILELYNKIYVWQGKQASTNEKHMSMNLANKYKTEWNKPKGTSVTRIPQGVEDSLFISFFEGFYKNDDVDAGTGKDFVDLNTKSKQDISQIANKHLEAAKLMLDKLGDKYDLAVYHIQDGYKTYEKVDNANEIGIFFEDETYVVDI